MSYQKIIILGNIGKIEQRFTPGGDSVVNFSVAVNDSYKKKDGTKVDETEWFSCVSFGKQSEVIYSYFQKGSQIMLSGVMKTRKWEDNTGATRYNTDLKVSEFSFVDRKSDNTSQNTNQQPAQHNNSAPQQAPQMPNTDDFDNINDQVPF